MRKLYIHILSLIINIFSRSQTTETVTVVFHALIADTKKFDPDNEDLHIAFGTDVLDKWKPQRWKMKRNRLIIIYHSYLGLKCVN